jgi:hypothetical protein
MWFVTRFDNRIRAEGRHLTRGTNQNNASLIE